MFKILNKDIADYYCFLPCAPVSKIHESELFNEFTAREAAETDCGSGLAGLELLDEVIY